MKNKAIAVSYDNLVIAEVLVSTGNNDQIF